MCQLTTGTIYEQRADTPCRCRRLGRARQPRSQLSATLKRRAEPRTLVSRRNHHTGEVLRDPARWVSFPTGAGGEAEVGGRQSSLPRSIMIPKPT